MKIVITMDWHTDGEVPENIQGELQENAIERVTDMLQQGYRQGELIWEHNTTGERITGWWSIQTITGKEASAIFDSCPKEVDLMKHIRAEIKRRAK